MSPLAERQAVLTELGRYWNPNAATALAAASRPIEEVAKGTTVIADDGSEWLDFAGSYGVFFIGHGNERVREAVRSGLKASALLPGLAHPALAELEETLLESLPPELNRFVLGSSGAETTETALRIAGLARPDRDRVLVCEDSYHGKTLSALSVLGQTNHRVPFTPFEVDPVTVPYGDADAVRRALAGGDVAAVFLEPVLGGAHLTVPPRGYVAEVARACRDTDTLLVVDEIQTGLGRTGKMFGFEHDGVVPDIVLLSKALTGGFVAVSVCASRADVLMEAEKHPDFRPGLLGPGSTVSAPAVSAAAATLREVRSQELPARAARLGPRLTEGLAAAVRRHPKHLIDAPGIGLMAGLRVRNPSVELLVSMGMAQRGIHTGHSLNESIDHPVLRFYPPATVSEKEIDRVLTALEETLVWLDRRPRVLTDAITWLLRKRYDLPPQLALTLSHSKHRVDW